MEGTAPASVGIKSRLFIIPILKAKSGHTSVPLSGIDPSEQIDEESVRDFCVILAQLWRRKSGIKLEGENDSYGWKSVPTSSWASYIPFYSA